MKHLMLLRHAKAEPAAGEMSDRDRPLAPRGHRDAAAIGRAMASGTLPDRALCSPARRTRETLADVLAVLPSDVPLTIEEDIYSAPKGDYIATIAAHGGSADHLLVVGHNPTIHGTAVRLIGTGEEGTLGRLAGGFPTGSLAIIAFAVDDWEKIGPGSGALLSFLTPGEAVAAS